MSKGEVLQSLQNASDTIGGNIGRKQVNNGKRQEAMFSEFFSTGGNSLVQETVRTDFSQGTIVGTNSVTDIATQNALIAVRPTGSSDTEFVFGDSFRIDSNGNYTGPSGNILLGWIYDATGNLPLNSNLSSLQPINVRGTSMAATATQNVSMSLNLNAENPVLEGAGQVFQVNNAGQNAGIKDSDIIIPEMLGNYGSMIQGTQFTLQSNGQPVTLEYGGIAVSNDISQTTVF